MGAGESKGSDDTGEMAETLPSREEGKGRRRQEGVVKSQGQMQRDWIGAIKGRYHGMGNKRIPDLGVVTRPGVHPGEF